MSRFGWDLPPGVTTSMLPGNSAADEMAESAAEALYEGFYQATRAGFSIADIMKEWRQAADHAIGDEDEEAAADDEMVRQMYGTESPR